MQRPAGRKASVLWTAGAPRCRPTLSATAAALRHRRRCGNYRRASPRDRRNALAPNKNRNRNKARDGLVGAGRSFGAARGGGNPGFAVSLRSGGDSVKLARRWTGSRVVGNWRSVGDDVDPDATRGNAETKAERHV